VLKDRHSGTQHHLERSPSPSNEGQLGASIERTRESDIGPSGRQDSRGPVLGKTEVQLIQGPFDAVPMTTVLWSHGPAMLAKMKEAQIPYRFKESEMLDLLTYLNSKAK
jgi:hypothetical protein